MKYLDARSQLGAFRKNGAGITARCPSPTHGADGYDKSPSLSVTEGLDGEAVFHCFAGCDWRDIKKALGESFTMGSRWVANAGPKWDVRRQYVYVDELSEPKYEKVLLEPTVDDPKPFRWRQYTPKGKKSGLKGITAIPYNLPDLAKSTEIFLAEGEKDADSLKDLGFTATSLKDWRPEFNKYIQGNHVTVLRDHDRPGVQFANKALETLYGFAGTLKLVDLYHGEPLAESHGKDVSDWIENARHNELKDNETIAEELAAICDRAEEWTPEAAVDENEDVEEAPILAKAHPEPQPACFFGLAGDFVELMIPHTEAHRMALLVQFLTYFGNIIGRSAYFQVEGDRHYTNLYTVLVGPTGCRKGTAYSRVKQTFKGIDTSHESECLASGLSSGEGLLYQVRDAVWTEKKDKNPLILQKEKTDAGAKDKRLLITEGEFAQVLSVQGRDGNTLKSYLRNLWDSGTAGSMTKNSPLKATNAQVSLVGHITSEELLASLDATSTVDGSVNRILWVAVRRTQLLPFGGDVPSDDLERLRGRIADAVATAKITERMEFTQEAKALWIEAYKRLETSRYGLLAKVTQRASPYTLRLACIFALLAGHGEISREHLQAALAVWQYCEDSARYIFGERIGDKRADTLLTALKGAPKGMTRSEIRDLFQRNINAVDLHRTLQILVDYDLASSHKVSAPNTRKSTEIWLATGST